MGDVVTMKDSQEIFLYIAYNLANQNQVITIDAIKRNLEWMLCEKFDPATEIAWLITNGFLSGGHENIFTLTVLGQAEAWRINQIRMKADFNRLINRATDSRAYLNFCEEIYGYRMYLFNMMDKTQLDYLFNAVSIVKSDIILDLGCGTGNILNHLVKQYGCRGIGIDQLDQKIIQKSSPLISYIDGNIDEIPENVIKSDITLAVDSLYFSNDLAGLIDLLRSIKNNRLYLYYSQYIFDETVKERAILHYDLTRLAQVLQVKAIPYQTVDYSANERALYEKSLQVLPKYQKAFIDEGNQDLFEMKLKEYASGKELYDKGLASRYLYITE